MLQVISTTRGVLIRGQKSLFRNKEKIIRHLIHPMRRNLQSQQQFKKMNRAKQKKMIEKIKMGNVKLVALLLLSCSANPEIIWIHNTEQAPLSCLSVKINPKSCCSDSVIVGYFFLLNTKSYSVMDHVFTLIFFPFSTTSAVTVKSAIRRLKELKDQ